MTVPPHRRFLLVHPPNGDDAVQMRVLAAALRQAGQGATALEAPAAEAAATALREHEVLVAPLGHPLLALAAAANKPGVVVATRPDFPSGDTSLQAAARVLVTASPQLFPPPADFPANAVLTGFLLPPPTADAAEEVEPLIEFERSGGLVVAAAFGHAEEEELRAIIHRVLATWPPQLPLVIHDAHGAIGALPGYPRVRLVRRLSLAGMFTYATVVVHDGTAGAVAAALHTGRPQLVLPREAEGDWWARAIMDLGVGGTLESASWPDLLLYAVQDLPNDVAIVRRVAECGTAVRAEEGAARAVAELEKL